MKKPPKITIAGKLTDDGRALPYPPGPGPEVVWVKTVRKIQAAIDAAQTKEAPAAAQERDGDRG